jgi:ribonuclease E
MLDTEPMGAATDGAAENDPTSTSTTRPRRRRAASRPAGPPQATPTDAAQPAAETAEPAEPSMAGERPARRRTAKKVAAPSTPEPAGAEDDGDSTAAPRKAAKRSRKKAAASDAPEVQDRAEGGAGSASVSPFQSGVLFRAPEVTERPGRATSDEDDVTRDDADSADEDDEQGEGGGPRRRRRGGRGRRSRGKGGSGGSDGTDGTDSPEGNGGEPRDSEDDAARADEDDAQQGDDSDEAGDGTGSRRRRRRRRRGTGEDGLELAPDDPPNTVVRVREPRPARSRGGSGDDADVVKSLKGSTRLEAKKQRRREGRDAGRKRPAIITEAEFLARRESVDRVMVVRQAGERTQIAVLEDGVLVEHYVASASSAGTLGNVYLGKVQNVLPSMEAAFVDIGKGRNAVLYAGEVNWDAAGLDGQPKRIELALKSGDSVLVQVTKDPIGHKGARLTSQISLAGRYLVYVPNGSMTGISRKLPENERARLKAILKKVVPDEAGVIVRTAAEGASEEELSRDVARLTAQWEDIEKKAKTASAPALLYGEPDLTIRVVRDIFNEDFAKLIVSGDDAWDMLDAYVGHVAPDLRERLSRWTSEQDVFAAHRIDEQLAKALDRKVWLPSGGYLIIDRTEAMIVIDVNTGKFTGAGGNLEETVTKNNVEAAEEIVRQLRLRDLGGMIVIDFIDMVLESNRELVLRRMLECLGRDRTKHQVAEVTSLGLVQMTRKRVGQGLFEAFSEVCECCNGRGVHIHTEPVDPNASAASSGGSATDRKGGRGRGGARKGAASSPAAMEDPVEPAGAPSAHVADDGAAEADSQAEPAPRRRRRRAEAPVTST